MAVGLVGTTELLEQLRVDAELRERFREAFRGDADPVDLLTRREAGVELVDGLYELKLAAYSRHENPADEARDGAALLVAQEREVALSEELDVAIAIVSAPIVAPPPVVVPTYRFARGWRPALVLAIVATLVTAVVTTPSAPADSLAIFQRPTSEVERITNPYALAAAKRVPGGVNEVRWLGAAEQIDIYAYQDEQYGICLATVDAGLVTSGACASLNYFETDGVFLEVRHNSGSGAQYLSIFWGPTGDVRTYPMTAEAVYRAGLERPRRQPAWPT
jgi:hypothetical protein